MWLWYMNIKEMIGRIWATAVATDVTMRAVVVDLERRNRRKGLVAAHHMTFEIFMPVLKEENKYLMKQVFF